MANTCSYSKGRHNWSAFTVKRHVCFTLARMNYFRQSLTCQTIHPPQPQSYNKHAQMQVSPHQWHIPSYRVQAPPPACTWPEYLQSHSHHGDISVSACLCLHDEQCQVFVHLSHHKQPVNGFHTITCILSSIYFVFLWLKYMIAIQILHDCWSFCINLMQMLYGLYGSYVAVCSIWWKLFWNRINM